MPAALAFQAQGGLQRPVRRDQQFARQRDQVGVARPQDGFGVFGGAYQADGDDWQADIGTNTCGKWHLETGLARRQRVTARQLGAAGRACDRIDADIFQLAAKSHRVVQRPADVDPVDRRDADKHRLVLRPLLADRRGHPQGQTHAVFQAAAISVVTLIEQRRQKGMQQVTVRVMQFDHVKTGRFGAARGVNVGADQLCHAGFIQRFGLVPTVVKGLAG